MTQPAQTSEQIINKDLSETTPDISELIQKIEILQQENKAMKTCIGQIYQTIYDSIATIHKERNSELD